jgi:tetratricopeptide (TPR) repeat protein
MDEALSEARELRHVHTLVHELSLRQYFDWLNRSPMMHLEEMLKLSAEHGFPFFVSWGLMCRGRSLITLGQAREGVALLTQGLGQLRPTGALLTMPMLFTWLAEAYALLHRPAEEQTYLSEAARAVEATDGRLYEAELLHRVPGDLLNAAGDQSGAERHYRQAIAVAERQSAKLFQLRASTSLARLWRDQGKREEARELLGPIYGWFTEGFDAPDLKDAKALWKELE